MNRLFIKLLLACLPMMAAAGVPTAVPRFETLGVAEGLPSSVVYRVAQDQAGFIWIGTGDGLARHDGVDMRVYRHDPRDPRSISGNEVYALLIDRDGHLWCGGEASGLNRLDRNGEHFQHWRHVVNDERSLGSDEVFALAQDRDGAIWVGTYLGGLNRLEADGSFLHVGHDAELDNSLGSNTVLSLYAAADGRLWIGTDIGLDVREVDGHISHVDLTPLTGESGPMQVLSLLGEADGSVLVGTRNGAARIGADLRFAHKVAEELGKSATMALSRDGNDALWLGTNNGLALLESDRLQHFVPTEGVPGRLPGPRLVNILHDREGGMWFGLLDGGVIRLPPHWRDFAGFRHIPGDPASLTHPQVRSIGIAPDGAVWAISGVDGLDRIDARTGAIERFGERLGKERERLWSILPVGDEMWIGSGRRLRILPASGGAPIEFLPDDKRRDALPNGQIQFLARAGTGPVWAVSSGGGMVRIDAHTHRIERYVSRDQRLDNSDIKAMALDRDGHPWVGSTTGIERYDPVNDRFEVVDAIPREPVTALAFAADGTLWLHRAGTLENYRPQGEGLMALSRIDAGDGWPALAVTGIVPAADGKLWISTTRGLWRVDPVTRKLRQFGERDGLPSAELVSGATRTGADGVIWAGTRNGVVAFDPAGIRTDLPAPTLALTGLSVRRGATSLDLDRTQPVAMRHGDRDLSVQVRALSYANTATNKYRFRLDGFDTGWIDAGNRGERVFSQLPAGSYVLHVAGRNAGGIWSELSSPLQVKVDPPPWATPWAYAAYAAVLLLLAAAMFESYRARIRRRHALALAETRRRAAEQLANAKSEFLATMSHEIRTPLTGVLGMTELLLGAGLDARQHGYAEAIHQSGDILLRVVNDSLDLARIEAGKLAIHDASLDPAALVRQLAAIQQPLAARKGLALDVHIEPGVPQRVYGDKLRIEQVLLNLLGNACKFTERGSVTLGLARGAEQSLVFSVADSGPGMSAEACSRLFGRFEQADGSITHRHGGSGLGLSICRELVGLMGGQIRVDSTPDVGSVFRVELPLREEAPIDTPIAVATDAAPASSGHLHVLVVEDDALAAAVIRGLLEAAGHDVVHAPHGLAALGELSRNSFDLAILDLDLPGIDGLQLARTIRAREADSQSQLPLLAVTARTDSGEDDAWRAAGIDAFLRKPMTGALLDAAVAAALSAAR